MFSNLLLAHHATLMGLTFLTLFISNNLIGWIGTFYEHMTPLAFWGLHAAIAAVGGTLVLLFGRALARILQAKPVTELRPAAAPLEVER